MSNEWAEMLKKVGIEAHANDFPTIVTVRSEANPAVQLLDLSDWLVVDVTGADAASFLQGQFCNDLQQVSATRAQITGYCTPKGRLLALPTIIGTENGFRMLIKSAVKDAFIKRLSMFIMRSDVTLTERNDLVCSGVIADSTGSVGDQQASLGMLPLSPLDVATSDTAQLLRWHDDNVGESRARYIFVTDARAALEIWKSDTQSEKGSHARWRAADISAGIPSITHGTNEAFVPQMINLQLIDALSFTKGCYPGQEIVARMQYLGKLKRHMRLFKDAACATNMIPGAKLSAGEDAEAGVVIDAVFVVEPGVAEASSGSTYLLAVVKVSADANNLSFEGQGLSPLNLPYELPSLDDVSRDSAS